MGIRRIALMCAQSSRCVWRTSRVWSASTPNTCARGRGEKWGHTMSDDVLPRAHALRALLFGAPLSARKAAADDGADDGADDAYDAALADDLNGCLDAAIGVLASVVGECDALAQARLEWSRVVALPPDARGIAGKRAALLYALYKEPTLRARFARAEDATLVADLADRVLPLTIPSFVIGMGQKPDALVALVTTLCELWPGERLGLGLGLGPPAGEGEEGGEREEREEGAAAHVQEAVGRLDDRGDREGRSATA